MERYLLDKNWEYVEANLQNPLLVGMLRGWKTTGLPHDYAIEKGCNPASAAGTDEGFFEGAGLYYRKSFVLKPEGADKRVWLEFEGVFGVAQVRVNGQLAAKHLNPYTGFWPEITALVHPGENEITLHVDSRMKPNSRWYVGTGLCRRVWLHIGENAAVLPHTLRCAAKSIEGGTAVLEVSARLSAPADGVRYELVDAAGQVAAAVDGGETAQLRVENAWLWSPEEPYLYTLRAIVSAGGKTDISEMRAGVRTVELDSKNGFRLNGVPRKLKGGCIHHDLGPLGAADHPAGERRRVRLLKESGFTALRLAHNPYGPALLDACDELGMLCIEEAFDEWVLGRTSFGLHITFEDRWERDLEEMIGRDCRHPCVIMWSTGNEVEERDGSAGGFAWAKRLADKVRELDPTRPVTASACALFSEYGQRPAGGTTGNQALNMAYDTFAEGRDLWGPGTAPYFAPLDAAGYNYKTVRAAYDGEKFPQRVIYGAESYPRAAFQSWQAVVDNANTIGDFVWTAWDYLGEVGVGRWEVSGRPRPSDPAWPWMSGYCGDFDLTGRKRPQSYYRDVLWGVSCGPKLFCLPPELTGKSIARLSWSWLPVEENYTFPGAEGQSMEAHIYADADEVELLQNGVSLGRRPCGKGQEYKAVFSIAYRPGVLEAVGYRNGTETGRDRLTTAGCAVQLELSADRGAILADGRDLCFVDIQAVDSAGSPVLGEVGPVMVSVDGGELLALASADPRPDSPYPFEPPLRPLYQGRALAVVRGRPGEHRCTVRATLPEGPSAEASIELLPAPAEEGRYVEEPRRGGPEERTLGELMDDPRTLAVLKAALGPVLDSPMLADMKGLSLKKLLSMGGQPLPPELIDALDAAWAGGQPC